ncbi:hypothetical protein D3C78_614130 [compost metagenome]
MAMLGGVLCSGDAIGSDYLFWEGYEAGKRANMPPAQIYYTKKKNMRNLSYDAVKGHHEAEQYETYDEAQSIAFRARGSFEGLFPSGIALHTRNAFQVLSEELCFPRWITIFWARPVGKKGKVDGGTNTAVQISIMNNVPCVNLYVEEQRTKFIGWVTAQLIKKGLSVPKLELIKEAGNEPELQQAA